MKSLFLSLALAFLLASPAHAQSLPNDGWPLHLALGAYMTLNGVDLSQTMYCIGQQSCYEQNRVMKLFADHPATFGGLKMGLDSAAVYALLKMHANHPKLAWGLSVLGIAGEGFAVATNRKYIHSAR